MTAAQVLENAPDIKALDSAISIRALQLALLQQQYAPNDPLLAGRPLTETPMADLSGLEGLNVGGSDFGSDKMTVGDATSVSQIYPRVKITLDSRRLIRSTFSSTNVTFLVSESCGPSQRP